MKSLSALLHDLQTNDHELALVHALEAWRAHRDRRIGDVIDRISAVTTKGALAGSTIQERIDIWKRALERGDASDVGRMLAVPWPGKWQNTHLLVQVLMQWPDDPRIGAAFAKLLAERPYRSQTVHRLYQDLLATVVRIGDVRARELLSKAPTASASAQLLFVEPKPLSAEETECLALIERHFAAEARADASKATSEAEHLAAIHQDSEDLARKSVYGDWLVERGDPRGELVSLQIARREGRATAETRDRERALIEKHGSAWAGALARHFEPRPLLFEDGFFAGGVMKYVRESDLEGVLEHPAWLMIRTLELPSGSVGRILDHPRLAGVRAVHGLDARNAIELATGPARSVEKLSFRTGWAGGNEEVLGALPSLPRLRHLSLAGSRASFILAAPVLSRLESLGIEALSEEQWISVAERGAALTTIELVNRSGHEAFLLPSGWRFRITRAAPRGPFTALEAEWIPGLRAHQSEKHAGLTRVLRSIPEGWLKSVVVHPSRALRLLAAELAALKEALARFPGLERLETPWDLAAARVIVSAPSGPDLDLRVSGSGFLEESVAGSLFDALTARGHVFDTLRVGYDGAPRPLGSDPRGKFLQWAQNRRTDRITLFRDGHPGECTVSRDRLSVEGLSATSLDELLDWLENILRLVTVENGTVRQREDERFRNDTLWPHARVAFGRVTILGGAFADLFDGEGLADLAAAAGDPSLRVRSARGLLMLASEEPTEARQAALATALRTILDRRLREVRGYDPLEALGEGIIEASHALGLHERRDEPQSWPISVSFVAVVDGVMRLLHAGVRTPFEDPRLTVSLRSKAESSGQSARDLVSDVLVPTRAALDEALALASVRAREQAAAFFADPAPRRRR